MKYLKVGLLVMAVGVLAAPNVTRAFDTEVSATLAGFSEVPAVSSTGTGTVVLRISNGQQTISYTLSYQNLEGTVTNAAHIHLGQPDVNGGVSVFLCGGGGRPACPPSAGEIEGTIVASDVVGPAGQGIAAGEMSELLYAIRKGVTYVNVHTNKHPSGEIRGNIPAE